ncbi:MAG: lysophospholipid acyltransferase family protein, partial [Chitinivorax sp.]
MMTKVALGLFAALPLWLIHALGIVLGELVLCLSSGFSSKLRANLADSGVAADAAGVGRGVRRDP